jgi:hypothetical protein
MLTGTYRIETQSSYYIFDFEKSLFRREGKEKTEGYYYAVPLRKDGTWIKFAYLENLEVGKPLSIISMDIADELDTATVRVTTPVLNISPYAQD